jgi:capsular exopolysaccharide synthesis family protein
MRERADRSLQAPGDAALYLNVPELGVIPAGRAKRISQRRDREDAEKVVELVTWQKKPSLLAESFRATLASILFASDNGRRPRVIVLTSAGPQEGKTTVASNLALAMAEISRKVLLIDADLRKPRLHEIFHLTNEYGLTDVLEGQQPPGGREDAATRTGYAGLDLLPAGSKTASIASLLHSSRMPELLEKVRDKYDAVLIDTPPMLHLPDARVLGRLADGVILVVRSNQTMRDAASSAAQRLQEDGTRILGTVLNDWDPKKSSGYSYGYRYRSYYHQYHQGDTEVAEK